MTEVKIEEFIVKNGELKLVKRKVVKREIPPDIAAVKTVLGSGDPLTEEQLQSEAQALFDLLMYRAIKNDVPAALTI